MAKSYEDINGKSKSGSSGRKGEKPPLELGGVSANVSWGLADPAMLSWFVAQLTQDGNAVILGTTRDGGALSVTVLAGETKYKHYIAPKDDLNMSLKEIGEYYG